MRESRERRDREKGGGRKRESAFDRIEFGRIRSSSILRSATGRKILHPSPGWSTVQRRCNFREQSSRRSNGDTRSPVKRDENSAIGNSSTGDPPPWWSSMCHVWMDLEIEIRLSSLLELGTHRCPRLLETPPKGTHHPLMIESARKLNFSVSPPSIFADLSSRKNESRGNERE